MKIKFFLLLFFFTFLSIGKSFAITTTCTAVGGGTWATATWSAGVPTALTDAVINSGVNISITTAAVCGSLSIGDATISTTTLTLAAGGSLDINGTTGDLTLNPNGVNRTFTLAVATQTVTIAGTVIYPLINTGRITISTGTITIGGLLTLGTLDVLSFSSTGTANLNGGLTDGAGTLTVVNGCTVNMKGTYTVNSALMTWAVGSNAIFTASTTITPTLAITFANLTISSGTVTLGGNINVAGNWTNNGIIAGNFTVIFSGAASQTITKTGGETFYALTCSGGGTKILANDITVSNTLTMTSGNINLNSNTLTLGNGTGASLAYTAGTAYGGYFKRYIPSLTNIVSTGGIPRYGLFPLGAIASYRPVEINSTVQATTGGFITASHTDVEGATDVAYSDNGGVAIQRITDMKSSLSTSGGLAGGTYNLDITFNGLSAGTAGNLRLETVAGPPYGVGTHAATAGTDPTAPVVKRTGLTVAELSNDFVVGTTNKTVTPIKNQYYSIATGAWNNTTTVWSLTNGGVACGCAPTSDGIVTITSNTTISLAANTTSGSLIIESLGKLNPNNFTMTVNGNLTVNGTVESTGGTTRVLTMNSLGKILDGTGVISTRVQLSFATNTTIASTANITCTSADILLSTAVTVTNNGRFIASGRGIDLADFTSNWTQGVNSFLSIGREFGIGAAAASGGTLNASATGNTVEYTRAGAIDITTPSSNTYYNLTIGGSSFRIMLANLIIANDLSISSILDPAAFNLNVGGNWTNTGTFDLVTSGGTPTVTFDGAADQTITNAAGESFCILNVNKTSGTLYLANNVSINQNTGYSLILNGIINCQNNTLSLGLAGAPNNAGTFTYSDGWIIGNFERFLPNTTGITYLFPVGNLNNYTPLNIVFNTIATQGSVIAKFVGSDPGTNGFNINDGGTLIYNSFVDGYWDLNAANGFAASDFNLQLTGNGFTAFTITTETRLLTRANSSSVWTANGTHVSATGSTAKRNNSTTISGQYCFGDITPCTGPSTPTITSSDVNVCSSSSGVYQVTNNAPNTYVWSIYPASAGTFNPAPASGDYQVTVDWGTTGQVGYVICKEHNSCTYSSTDSLAVNIHSIAPLAITGNSNVAIGTTGVTYSVTNISGYTYTWTITGGTQASGTTTNSITVDWDNNSGAGEVSVVAQKTGCSAASATSLSISKYAVMNSNGTGGGDWNTAATWDCACIPSASSSVRILIGDIVTQANYRITITNLIIDGDGALSNGTLQGESAFNRGIRVTGDLTVNGILEINSTGNLQLRGINTSISGVGKIKSNIASANVVIQSGNKTVLASTNLTIVALVAGSGRLDITTTGISVTNNGSISIEGDLNPSATTGTSWTNAANSTLKIGGAINANLILYASESGNTVEYSAAAAQNILNPFSSTYSNLTCSGSLIKTVPANLIISGNLTISGSASIDVSATPFNLSVGGNWTNTSIAADPFVQRTGSVTFNGTNSQSLTGTETFYSLIINNLSNTLTLNNTITATNALTMTSGNIDAGVNRLILGTVTPFEGALTYASGTIIGEFQRFLTSTGSKLFPVGVATNYRPITLMINTLSASGSVITKFVATNPGNTGLPLSESSLNMTNQFTEGYWNLTAANSFVTSNYDVISVGSGFSSYSITSSTRIIKRTDAGSWLLDGTHSNSSGETCFRNGLSGGISSVGTGSQFAFAITDCPIFSTSAITGSADVCSNASGVTYSVTDNGRTYTWSVPGGLGSVVAGQGTATATIDWIGTASPAEIVQVIESSACYTAPAVTINVALHSNVTSVISGLASVSENTAQGPYTVTARTGYTYTWSVPVGNGSISSGQGTNSVTVAWGLASAATLRVIGQYGSCTVAPNSDLAVTVYAPITTVQAGNWNVGATWSSGIAPTSIQNVRIQHAVTITDASKTINDITIESAGSLTHNVSYNLTVTGAYSNSGIHNLGNNSLILNSTSAGVFTGTNGTLTNVAGIQFNTNNFTIPSSAILSITNSGTITIASNLTLTNNGNITISGAITGGNSSSTWLNSTNSTLKIGGSLLATGILTASSSGNTIEYYGTGNQNIKTPSSGLYHNLTLSDISGNSTKSLQGSLYCNNNLSISGTAALDVISVYNLYVRGNWDVTSTNANPFVERSATVFFDGSSAQSITTVLAGGETFNLLTLSGTSTKTLGSDITVVNNFTNSLGSTFHVSASNFGVTIKGNWTNNGTFSKGLGTVSFNGVSAQTMSGATTFNNLTIDNVSGVSISSGTHSLIGALTLSNGTFNTGGNSFTMVSNASQTARIAPVTGTGAVSGNFTIERYISGIPDGTQDWADLSSPVVASTMADWENELFFSYPHSPPASYSNVVAYDETIADYVGVTAATPLNPGQGFEMYLTNDATLTSFTSKTLTTVGVPNIGPVVIPVNYTLAQGAAYGSGTPGAYSGENLVGNPFASTINLSLLNFSPEVLTTVDVWDRTTSAYLTLTGGALIGPHQGFWAYTSGAASGTITIPESAKSTDLTTGIRLADGLEPFLKLTIKSSNGSNTFAQTLKVACDPAANDAWDNKDFPFKQSPNPLTPIITTNAGSLPLSISTFNSSNADYVMPLNTTVGIAGSYQISFEGVSFVDNTYPCILLEDKVLNQFIDLHSINNYIFLANPTDNSSRFALHFSKNASSCNATTTSITKTDFGSQVQILPNQYGNTINFNFSKPTETIITITNLLGQAITRLSVAALNQSIKVALPEEYSGLYVIKIESSQGSIAKKFVKNK